ncbi:hypothetical protein ACR6HW_13365 [Fusibacter sp. JL298sf-3]
MKPVGKSAKAHLLEAQLQGYAIPAFNIHNLETLQVVWEVAVPLVLHGASGFLTRWSRRAYSEASARSM